MFKIRKPTITLFIFLTIICTGCLLLTACKDKTDVLIPNPPDTSALGKINHFITKDSITLLRTAFNNERKRLDATEIFITESEGFNKPALLKLLENKDCVGIRIYYGITNDSTNGGKRALKMIIVGTNSQGKDLLTDNSPLAADLTQTSYGLEYGQCCQGQPAR